MLRIIRIFLTAPGTRPWLVLASLLLASLAEMLSVSAMLPALMQISGEEGRLPPAFARAVDTVLHPLGLEPTLGVLVSLVVATITFKNLMMFAALTYAGFTVARVATSMRQRLIERLFAARWSYFVDTRFGRFANAISNDATRAGQAYMESAKFVTNAVQVVTYLIIAAAISMALAAGIVVIVLFMIGGLGKLIAVSRRAGGRQRKSTSDLVVHVSDALNNIKPIKAMNRSGHFLTLFSANIDSLRAALRRQVLAAQGLTRGAEVLITAVIGIGCYVAVTGLGMSLAELAVSGVVLFQAMHLVRRMQDLLQRASEVEASFTAVEGLEHELALAREPTGTGAAASLVDEIRFDQVSFAHGSRPVVRDVDFTIPAGSITVLQGPSGAGKTTLVDLLLGLHVPDRGRILIDGRPLTELSLESWRDRIGYVPQELSLLHASLRDNLTLGNRAIGDADIARALDLAGATGFIDTLPDGLDTDVGELGARLSGGQRQRIALARALVGRPQLVILDEVTSALDPETEAGICANVAALAGDYTIVAITHRSAWSDIATHLYKVAAGRVTRIAPHPAAAGPVGA